MSFYAVDMPRPDVALVTRCRVAGTIAGFPWNNIWYFGWTTTNPELTTLDMDSLAQNLYEAYSTTWTGVWSPEVTLEEVTTVDLTTTTSPTGAYVHHAIGTAADDFNDSAASVLCKNIITRRYRGGHPRKYLPPMTGSLQLSDREWDHSEIDGKAVDFGTAIQNIATSPTHAYTAGDAVSGPVNVSYYQGFTNYTRPSGRNDNKPTLRGAAVVDNVVGIELEYVIATQRRRIGR